MSFHVLPCAYPWTPDQGDGTFRNPILCADYSDPDVIRHGEDFYLTASSFNCTPGLPILHSRDLVNWTLVNHALKNLPDERYCEVQPGCGVWAPALRFHAGRFWIFFPTPDEGIYVTTASHPAAEWSPPQLVQAGKGLIDPCPLWDDDGQAHLVHAYAHSRSGLKHMLRVRPMAPDGSRLLGEGQVVFHDPVRHPTLEGPKFLKKDGWYYILAPAGGVQTGWQVVLRSRNIYGPYEDKIVLAQGRTPVNGPHQGALVDLPNGEWWFVHFQDAGVYGRITHLQPVQWQDGWPLMGINQDANGTGEPALHFQKPCRRRGDESLTGSGKRKTESGKQSDTPHVVSYGIDGGSAAVPQTSDEFDSPRLGLQWQWQANHEAGWCALDQRPGWLRLFAQPLTIGDLGRTPNLLLQKFPARTFAVETRLEFAPQSLGEETGLVVTGRAHAALALRRSEPGTQVIFRHDGAESVLAETSGQPVSFRLRVGDGGLCQFSFAMADREWTVVPEKFQAQPGVWIGAKVGLYAITTSEGQGGCADFDYVRFLPAGNSVSNGG